MYDDRVYELYALREQAREAGLPFEPSDATPQERADLDRLIAELDPPTAADARPDLPPATGRYRFESFLARGGMGEVYRGEDTVLHRPVALKVLRRRLGVSASTFRAEAELVARLAHPGIVPVHDAGVLADGRPFFAMKLVDGRTLEDALGRSTAGDPELPRRLQWFEQVCQAVAYAHAQSPPLLHRDLKPQNVMVGAYGEVLVMDWGIARVTGAASPESVPVAPVPPTAESTVDESRGGTPEETATGVAKGTVAYMAPEQARGERGRIGPAADVFGLGGILCRTLTGAATFAGDGGWERAVAGDLSEAHARLDACGADEGLVAVAKRCLASDPSNRYAHAGEAASAVQGYLASVQEKLKQAEVERARVEAKAESERRRRRLAWILAASVALFAVAGAVGAVYSQGQRSKREAADQARRERAAFVAESTLAQVPDLWDKFLWKRAEQNIVDAEATLGEDGDPALRQRLADALEDTRFLARIDHIQLDLSDLARGFLGGRRTELLLLDAFRERGFDFDGADEASLSETWARDRLRRRLVDIVDAWCAVESDPDRYRRLRRLTSRITGDEWRKLLEEMHPDRPTLQRLAEHLKTAEASAAVFYHVAEALDDAGGEGVEVLLLGRRRHPDDFWIHMWLGILYAESRNLHPLAEAAFHAALVLRPGAAMLHVHVGNALSKQGKFDEALAEHQQALALDPECLHAQHNLASTLGQMRRFEEAERQCEVILAGNRAFEETWELLAAIRANHGDLPGAIRAQREYVARLAYFPKAAALTRLGVMLLDNREEEAAMDAWRQALLLNPAAAEPCRQLGRLHLRRKEHRKAVENLETVVGLERENDADWRLLAEAYLGLQRPNEARRSADRAIELKPDSDAAHQLRGLALVESGDHPAAAMAFERATKLDGSVARHFGNLCLALWDCGRYRQAEEALVRAATLDPKLKDVEEHRRRIAAARKLESRLRSDEEGTFTTDEFLALAVIASTDAHRKFPFAHTVYERAMKAGVRLDPDESIKAAEAAVQFAVGNSVQAAPLDVMECHWLCDRARRLLENVLRSQPTRRQLNRCRFGPRFAPVRDTFPPALDTAAREAWQRLWVRFDAALEGDS